ncbi:MAG: RNA recognition motif domain-containing protein [Bryobacteraceae bacterium]
MKKIFVGNLSFSTTQEELTSIFAEFGAVDQVEIVRNRDTGQSRGFAFVAMGDSGEAEKAIEALNGREVNGRALNVNEARPKPEGGSHGGGFGRNQRSGGGDSSRRRREPRW